MGCVGYADQAEVSAMRAAHDGRKIIEP